jgi:hypothetical protein
MPPRGRGQGVPRCRIPAQDVFLFSFDFPDDDEVPEAVLEDDPEDVLESEPDAPPDPFFSPPDDVPPGFSALALDW